MLNFNFAATDPANQMVMIFARYLIGQVTMAAMRWTYQSVLCQEFESSLNGRLGQARQLAAGLFIDLSRREVRSLVMQNVQDRQTL